MKPLSFLTALLATAAFAAPPIFVPRDTVEPATLLDTLDLRDLREGDTFLVRVKDDRYFPSGTKFEGRVQRVRPIEKDHEGVLDASFLSAILPTGERISISARPCSLKNTIKTRDGRLVAKVQRDRSGEIVGAGAVVGFLLGSTVHKQFEGTFAGILAGILVAQSEKPSEEANVVGRRGDEIGVWFDQSVGSPDARAYQPYNAARRTDGEELVEVRYNDRALRYGSNAPFRGEHDSVYVPVEDTARQLGISVTDVRGSDMLLLERDDNLLKVDRLGKEYKFNGKRASLDTPMLERRGVLYAPFDLFGIIASGHLAVRSIR